MLLHRHTNQLLGHFHGDFVVTDEQELGATAHARHQLGVALGVGVVQRRVHLVEQAKRGRIELKNRKHQRDGGQRFFTAREQMNRLVFLARRLRHDLHARVQNLVARHHEFGLATAKQLGEHLAKVFVDGVERAAEQLTGFAVDLADGVFQRGHGLHQVGRLRVQELLALTGCGQLIQRGQIHRTQGGNLAVQAVDFTLQTGQTHRAGFNRQGQCGQIGFGVLQQLAVLLKTQACGLRLELNIGDALAQRLLLTVQLQTALITGAQLGGQVVVFAAAGGEVLLALQLEGQRVLQAGLSGGVVQAGEFIAGALRFCGHAGGLLRGRVHGAGEFGLARVQRAQ